MGDPIQWGPYGSLQDYSGAGDLFAAARAAVHRHRPGLLVTDRRTYTRPRPPAKPWPA